MTTKRNQLNWRRFPRLVVVALLASLNTAVGVAQSSPLQNRKEQLTKMMPSARMVIDDRGASDYNSICRFWIANDRLLVVRRVASGNLSVIERNLVTGRSAHLGWLEEAFSSEQGYPDSVRVSPDGRRMLWPSLNSSQDIYLVDLEKKLVAKAAVPAADEYNCVWTTDNDTWRLFTGINDRPIFRGPANLTTVYTARASNPRVFGEIGWLAESSPLNRRIWIPRYRPFEAHLDATLALPDFTMLVATHPDRSDPEIRMTVSILDLRQGGSAVSSYIVFSPPNHHVRSICFSPDARRVAWVADDLGITGTGKPYVRPRLLKQALYISNIDGTRRKRIGSTASDWGYGIDDLCWLPDGKTLAFECQKCTWTLPIN